MGRGARNSGALSYSERQVLAHFYAHMDVTLQRHNARMILARDCNRFPLLRGGAAPVESPLT